MRTLFTLALFAPLMASAQVYKCKDSTGSSVIQQVPCAGSGASVRDDIRAREADRQRQRAIASQAEVARQERAQVEKAEEERQRKINDEMFGKAAIQRDCKTDQIPEVPTVGMTEFQLIKCTQLGRANVFRVLNTTEVPGAVSRQYGSEWGAVRYVYTRNGVVTGIQR